MNFTFKIGNTMKFKMENAPQKEYIEKEAEPCVISFSTDALFADLVSPVFETEEKENSNGD